MFNLVIVEIVLNEREGKRDVVHLWSTILNFLSLFHYDSHLVDAEYINKNRNLQAMIAPTTENGILIETIIDTIWWGYD